MLTEKEKNLLKCLCELYITVAYVAKSSSAKYDDAIRIKMFNDKYTLVVQTIRYNDTECFKGLETDTLYSVYDLGLK